MQAKEIMKKNVVTVTPKMTLREVAQIFTDKHITGAPVVGPAGDLVGVVSQTDLVRHDREASPVEVPYYHQQPEEGARAGGFHMEVPDLTRVEEVMTPWAVSFEEDTSVMEIAKQMLKKHIHRVVITRAGRIAGIVTSMDMLRAFVAGAGSEKTLAGKK